MPGSQKYKGKKAEKLITKKLKELTANKAWWYHRFPDAGVCQGRLPKQPADYAVMCHGKICLLESKETNNRRIALTRFTQIPKMRLFSMAGGRSFFIILRTDTGYWNLLDITDVANRGDDKSINLDTFVSYPNIDMLFCKLQGCLIA